MYGKPWDGCWTVTPGHPCADSVADTQGKFSNTQTARIIEDAMKLEAVSRHQNAYVLSCGLGSAHPGATPPVHHNVAQRPVWPLLTPHKQGSYTLRVCRKENVIPSVALASSRTRLQDSVMCIHGPLWGGSVLRAHIDAEEGAGTHEPALQEPQLLKPCQEHPRRDQAPTGPLKGANTARQEPPAEHACCSWTHS
jgi:hypothetical protein